MFGVVGMDLLRNEAIFHGGFHNGNGIPYKRILLAFLTGNLLKQINMWKRIWM